MKITKKSAFTGIEHTLEIPVTRDQINNWNNGQMIQKAMPYLTPGQREFLMTGITEEEWKETFDKTS